MAETQIEVPQIKAMLEKEFGGSEYKVLEQTVQADFVHVLLVQSKYGLSILSMWPTFGTEEWALSRDWQSQGMDELDDIHAMVASEVFKALARRLR